jgi:predicted nucleotidyltransferase
MASTVDPSVIDIARAYIKVLRENNIQFESAWLFGSAVRNQATDDSDIDIALVMRNVEAKILKEAELMKFRRRIDSRIEPHILITDDLDSPFSVGVMETGIKIA